MTTSPSAELVHQPRSNEGQVAGVCAALAERWNIDPLLVRAAMVLSTLSGGVGAVVYGALWLWMPPADGGPARIEQWLPAWKSWSTARVVLLICLASIVMLAATSSVSPFGIGPLIVLGLVIVIGRRHVQLTHQRVPGPEATGLGLTPAPLPGATLPGTTLPGAALPGTALPGFGSGMTAVGQPGRPFPAQQLQTQQLPGHQFAPSNAEFSHAVHAWQSRMQQVGQAHATAVVPAPVPRNAVLMPATTGRAELGSPPARPEASVPTRRTGPRPTWWGGLLVAALASAAWVVVAEAVPGNPLVAIGAALLVIALGLVVGAFVGRPRLMIALGLVVSLVVAPVSVLSAGREGPVAQSLVWTNEAQLRDVALTGQTANLDLSGLSLSEDRTVTVEAHSSAVAIEVSPTMPVTVIYTTAPGAIVIDNATAKDAPRIAGPGETQVEHVTAGHNAETLALGPASGPRLTLVLRLAWSMGAVHAP